MAHFTGVAREQGLTEEEVEATMYIVMGVSAGKVRAQFNDVFQK